MQNGGGAPNSRGRWFGFLILHSAFLILHLAMPQPLYIICPGQGAQAVGMGKDYFESSPVARDVFETANRVIGFDLAALCFNGAEDRLNQTDISQPAIFATGVAAFRAAREAGKIDPAGVTAYAGLSL